MKTAQNPRIAKNPANSATISRLKNFFLESTILGHTAQNSKFKKIYRIHSL